MGEAAGGASSNPTLSQLQVTIQSAKLTQVGGLFSTRPDPYLELIVDGQPPRKTEVVRKTTTPKWDEHFTVLVTPYSKLELRVLSSNSIRTDTLLGQVTIVLYTLLEENNGKLDSLKKTLELKGEKGKHGEVSLVLHGLEVNLRRYPKKTTNGPRSSVPNGTATTPTTSAPPAAEARSQTTARMPRSTSKSTTNAASRSAVPVPPASTTLSPSTQPAASGGSPALPQNGTDPDEGGELGENTLWYLTVWLVSTVLVARLH